MTQLFLDRPTVGPKECAICYERFSEEWMAERCQAQGRPYIEYHPGDVLVTKGRTIAVVNFYHVHHGIGVKCEVEGPCPHDITYYGHRLVPMYFGGERAFIAPAWASYQIRTGYERITTLNQPTWGIIPESGSPETYLVPVDLQVEWEKLWSYYPEKQGRRGSRRLGGKDFGLSSLR